MRTKMCTQNEIYKLLIEISKRMPPTLYLSQITFIILILTYRILSNNFQVSLT